MIKYKPRAVYDQSAEITVYIKPEFTGNRIGNEVLARKNQITLAHSIIVLLGVIPANNTGRLKAFEKRGGAKNVLILNRLAKNSETYWT